MNKIKMNQIAEFLVQKLNETPCIERISSKENNINIMLTWEILDSLDNPRDVDQYKQNIRKEIEQAHKEATNLFGNNFTLVLSNRGNKRFEKEDDENEIIAYDKLWDSDCDDRDGYRDGNDILRFRPSDFDAGRDDAWD